MLEKCYFLEYFLSVEALAVGIGYEYFGQFDSLKNKRRTPADGVHAAWLSLLNTLIMHEAYLNRH